MRFKLYMKNKSELDIFKLFEIEISEFIIKTYEEIK